MYPNSVSRPVYADHHQDAGREDEAASPEHHKELTEEISRLPLDGEPPHGLHGEDNVADDGVRQGEVEHEVVDVRCTPHLGPEQTDKPYHIGGGLV